MAASSIDPLRLGRISYLNVLPIYYPLESESSPTLCHHRWHSR